MVYFIMKCNLLQMNDGNHGMGVGSVMHMNPQGGGVGGHSQMNIGSVMGSENQNLSQRQMCVRNGCSNAASNSIEYAHHF
jgi:hypothetical protein